MNTVTRTLKNAFLLTLIFLAASCSETSNTKSDSRNQNQPDLNIVENNKSDMSQGSKDTSRDLNSKTDVGQVEDMGTDPGPLRPEDVPSVKLDHQTSECPAGYVNQAPKNGLNDNFKSANKTRDFILLLPDPTIFEGPRPLFVGFNGTSENGSSFSRRALLSEFAERGFIVIAPSSIGAGRIWPPWDDMRRPDDHGAANVDIQFFDDVVGCVAAHHEIDKNRIYVGGHSAGGIFTNAVLQRRSKLIAGGITASGLFDLTAPIPSQPLDDMFVMVTWGGDRDLYTGGGISISFVEQAAQASEFYDAHPKTSELNCQADPSLGHKWLDMNSWFIDRLLEHPKGLPGKDGTLNVPSPPAGFTCQDAPFSHQPTFDVSCPVVNAKACQDLCQMTADCIVENDTVNLPLRPQLEQLGFALNGANISCGGCVSQCESAAPTQANLDAAECILSSKNQCGPGLEGFLPYADAINTCCAGRDDSSLCTSFCDVFLTNPIAPSLLPTCVALRR